MTRASDIAVELYGELRAAKARLRQRRQQLNALRKRLDSEHDGAVAWRDLAERRAVDVDALRGEMLRMKAERDALANENALLMDVKCDVCRAWWRARGKR